MRRGVVLALLALALPLAAWANTIDFTNEFGSINISMTNGITSTYSPISSYNGTLAPRRGAQGWVSFGTGAFSGSSLASNGTFSATGSWFDVVRHRGGATIFSGAFVGPISWTNTTTTPGRFLTFELSGEIRGMLNGHEATGMTYQYFKATKFQLDKGIAHITGGSTSLTSTPEPGTLGLLGTGLVGIAGIFRRKKSA
jgi:hypothetical protein